MAALQFWYDGVRMGDTAQYNEIIETITDANSTQQGIAAELGAAMGDVNLEIGRFLSRLSYQENVEIGKNKHEDQALTECHRRVVFRREHHPAILFAATMAALTAHPARYPAPPATTAAALI